jgi:nitrogen-specific signal transduction histidine kinase
MEKTFYESANRSTFERLLSERAELENQLQHAQRLSLVGQLATGIAHDFNNLLTVILSFGEILLDETGPDPTQRERVKMLVEAGEKAAGLARQILAFSRRQPIDPIDIALNDIVTQTARMVVRIVGEHVTVGTVLASDLGVIRADPGQIEQVIMNLVVNAWDAMPHGGRLTIETANVEVSQEFARMYPLCRSGQYVVLAVTDTGVGMDEATQARIFEPFFTTKEAGRGTGLGLAVVRRIVDQAGGWILVDSVANEGTTFTVYLPRATGQSAAAKPQPRAVDVKGHSELVLVVEDSVELRELTRTVLESYGYRVVEAADGDEALQIAARFGPDIKLLLADVVMPGMNGRVIAECLVASIPDLRVLLVTGQDDALALDEPAATEMPYLLKPFTPHTLVVKVREVLGAA